MNNFFVGQRWISNSESELGLGLIAQVDFNRITVLFLACDERRIYAKDNAPLTRVIFSVGDTIESTEEEKLTIIELREENGIVTYITKNTHGKTIELEEGDLNHHSQFNKPQDRLFTGQIDPNSWFLLRYETWRKLQQHQQSPVKGLLGGRTSLIPHQVFIAYEAANRAAPRIMLADEVGLGKTIEAGLILHHRLNNGLTHRVLIIVPDSLLHQWLVEMRRRFNLNFSIFDELRCLSELGEDDEFDENNQKLDEINPFSNAQLVLCSQQFFSHYPKRQLQALEAAWDMVIVDEAHHLEWNETQPSADYLFIEKLARLTPSLILLTATPEQLGKESHFARLRLLDPDRFYSFSAFLEEETLFEPVANSAKLLLANDKLTAESEATLKTLLKNDNAEGLLKNLQNPEKSLAARQSLIKILLDHHGTGRILFRNSRYTVKGFPQRERFGYELTGEMGNDLTENPYYIWLVEKMNALDGQKALLICKHAQTAIDLEHTLKMRAGIASAVFHEHLTIIERDRAAAYFADPESSAKLLICSEIGSEGRNFQFVHHLILWDLPNNPDLLQQRIGRLDRIGQKNVIQIHIPYLKNSAQAVLFYWYDLGLDAFHRNNGAAQHVEIQVHNELQMLLQHYDLDVLNALIQKTKLLSETLETELHNGRDQLLELNSCRKDVADSLLQQLTDYENDGALWMYMDAFFDCFGVDTEEHSRGCYILQPSEHLRFDSLPYFEHDAMTITVNREIALAREELPFLTWEHPMVTAAMDLVLSSETGNAAISVVSHPDLKGGQFLLECLFVVECSAPAEFQIGRFLPHTPVRVLIDQHKIDITDKFTHEALEEANAPFDKGLIVNFLNKQRGVIQQLVGIAEERATLEMQALITDVTQMMLESLSAEIKRLMRLKKVNSSIKTEEIELLKDMTMLAHEQIQAAQCRLDAIRFLIVK